MSPVPQCRKHRVCREVGAAVCEQILAEHCTRVYSPEEIAAAEAVAPPRKRKPEADDGLPARGGAKRSRCRLPLETPLPLEEGTPLQGAEEQAEREPGMPALGWSLSLPDGLAGELGYEEHREEPPSESEIEEIVIDSVEHFSAADLQVRIETALCAG